MNDENNKKIESYYDHKDAYPKNNDLNAKIIAVDNSDKKDEQITIVVKKPPFVGFGEVISPLYGIKLDAANEYKIGVGYNQKKRNEINKATVSINEIVTQKVNEQIALLQKENSVETRNNGDEQKEKDFKFKSENIQYIQPSRNRLSDQAEKTQLFLFKPRKNGENIFGERTAELSIELEDIKEKIRTTNPRQSLNEIYEQTAMFEGIEEQKEINKQIRQAMADIYHVNDQFDDSMSLSERRRQIEQNSIQASSQRLQTLKNLNENNLNNQFLRKPKGAVQSSSQYHKVLKELRDNRENKEQNDYFANRNPYLARMTAMQEKNEKEAEENRRERIKEQIASAKKHNGK